MPQTSAAVALPFERLLRGAEAARLTAPLAAAGRRAPLAALAAAPGGDCQVPCSTPAPSRRRRPAARDA